MAQVIYNGNGSDGGQVPVDSNTYASGATVNVAVNDSSTSPHQQKDSNGNPENIVTGSLKRTGATFLYWNTAADGSGTYHGPLVDSTFTFPNQTGDLTLYAQWAITTGLTNGGATTHYQFAYDQKLGGAGGIEPARTNAVIAACEGDFTWMQTQFAGVDITKGVSLPIPTFVTALGGGASWWPLKLKPGSGPASSLRALMVAEVTEMFMSAQKRGWGYSSGVNNEESCGEALSLFLTVQFQLAQGFGGGLFNTGSSNAWLNSSLPASNPASTEFDGTTHYGARKDYVNSTLPFAGNGPGTGGSMLFIYYLFHQLGFSIPDIVAAAPGLDSNGNPITGACLRGVYQNLTGDTSDPFPYFASLLATAYPTSQVASIPGPNTDDPWPLGTLSFVGAKNTWGHDEINDIIAHGGTYPDGFYLALDGFSRNIVGGAEPSIPTIAFGGATTALSATPPSIFYQSSNPKVPQRIMFAYDVKFAQPLGTFPSSGEKGVAVNSSINLLGLPMPAATEFFFLAGADPYFTNVVKDPTDSTKLTVPWLSEDLRVFTATPGAPGAQSQFPVPGGPQFVENSTGGNFDFNGAYAYIQALLKYLNQTYGDPSGVDPFEPASNVIPQQATEFTADSSVTPFTTIGGSTFNNYSFAIARVRLKGSTNSAALGVRVFFRLWGTQTADTAWDPTETYLSHNDASGKPLWPLAPPDNHTIPFFAGSAQPNFTDPNDPEFGKGGFTNTGSNHLTITIAQGDSQWAYFGCFLNVNDPSVVVNGVAIPNALPGTHHCLVAQMAYPGAPIQTVGTSVPTPESSDQLAQRNLQVTTSDNPGPASAHRVPQTFDLRPSGTPPATGPLAGQPDELMIIWGDVPVGSVARIYWPAVSSAEVLKLASWMYGVHPLTAADSNTIQVNTIKGVTFVPIPQGTGDGFAGLLTVDLPQTVKTGQEFDIVLRRIGKRPLRVVPPPPPPPPPIQQIPRSRRRSGGNIDLPEPGAPTRVAGAEMPPGVAAAVREFGYERYIVGSFQVKIPVSTREVMLPLEETTLAILKARLEAMPKTNRWYPVLARYIEQVAGRVDGLGGNAGAISPSLGGYRPGPRPCQESLEEFTGKVCEVVFNCFGEFVGFTIDDCCRRRTFENCRRDIAALVLRALKERLT
ncbi:MAG TPA: hypothetical protein VMU04_20330, partial [Candidatus Acidoferrum sp.]|nr:hypothetical protein [Candidatus Acidoferrum sp.]